MPRINKRGNSKKQQQLWLLCTTHHLILVYKCISFIERSLTVIEQTRFVTDRWTDGQTDTRRKTICLPILRGGGGGVTTKVVIRLCKNNELLRMIMHQSFCMPSYPRVQVGFFIQFNAPFKIISAHMRPANQ